MNTLIALVAACGICTYCSALIAAEENMAIDVIRTRMKSALNHPCLVVTGTVVTLMDGNPLSTTSFTGRFKKPSRWMITWQDTGTRTFKPSGTVWGDGTTSHLLSTGSKEVETTTDIPMTIAAATGISHKIAPWLYGLFHGQLRDIVPDHGAVSQVDGSFIVSAEPRAGHTLRVTISHDLIAAAETISDTSKAERVDEPEFDDQQATKLIERQGEKATPEKITKIREMIAHAHAAMAKSTSVFSSSYVFQWQLDRELNDAELLPSSMSDQPAK